MLICNNRLFFQNDLLPHKLKVRIIYTNTHLYKQELINTETIGTKTQNRYKQTQKQTSLHRNKANKILINKQEHRDINSFTSINSHAQVYTHKCTSKKIQKYTQYQIFIQSYTHIDTHTHIQTYTHKQKHRHTDTEINKHRGTKKKN